MAFAVYGPDPYFKMREAIRKFHRDLERLQECWSIPSDVSSWRFVVNYPGTPATLLREVAQVAELHQALEINLWSRYDLTQQFLLYANRDRATAELGTVEIDSKALAPLSLVPEGTALPVEDAQRVHRRLWARLTGNKQEYHKTEASHIRALTERPLECLLAHTHMVLGVIATAIDWEVLEPNALSIRLLRREAGLYGDDVDDRDLARAWGLPMSILMQEDWTRGIPPISADVDEAVMQMANTSLLQERLALALIHIISRETGDWEIDVLDAAWDWAAEKIKIRDDGLLAD
jgi:hypothetical protein